MTTCKECGWPINRGGIYLRKDNARCVVCRVEASLKNWRYPAKPQRAYDADAARRYRAARKVKLLAILRGQA